MLTNDPLTKYLNIWFGRTTGKNAFKYKMDKTCHFHKANKVTLNNVSLINEHYNYVFRLA